MNLKDWFIIVGTILILVILIDGIRRKRNERYGNIKVSRSLKKSLRQHHDDDDEIPAEPTSYTSELPNGGARVVGQRDPAIPVPSIEKKAQAKSFIEKRSRQQTDFSAFDRRSTREPQQTSLNLDESVPMLMESVEEAQGRQLADSERIEPSFSAYRDEDLDDQPQGNYQDRRADERDYYMSDDDICSQHERENIYQEDIQAESDVYVDDERESDDYDDQYAEDEYVEDDYDTQHDESASRQNLAEKQPAEPEEVLIINVMAAKGSMFNGGDLLDIILKCGMRYGSMDIFHRYSDAKGEGALLFSMANMVKPGTFDLDAMDEFETPGISLFMTLPINADSMQSFELMVDTAEAIADGLNGEMKDEQRSAMTRQTLEHCRQRIRDFERMRLFRRPPR